MKEVVIEKKINTRHGLLQKEMGERYYIMTVDTVVNSVVKETMEQLILKEAEKMGLNFDGNGKICFGK